MQEARILDKQRFTAEPGVDITLFQGIPKQGKMEIIVQKAVELGVNRIVPVFMKRTVVTDKGNFRAKKSTGGKGFPQKLLNSAKEALYRRFCLR